MVGASVLYHLTEAGWTDVVLLERKQLTAGSTWHAAGGMHTLNGDPNVARLQQYTVNLYKKIEAQSGQACSIHLPGGLMLADTPERMDWLRMAQARGRYLGMDLELISMAEAKELNPLMDESYFVGALYDPDEGSVDPYGVTHAYAICARQKGAEVFTDTWVTDLRQRADGTWDVVTDKGEIHTEHVVNAGGLWAREVGRMAGLELPVLAMAHHYLLTEPMDEVIAHNERTGRELPHMIDFSGEIYARQEGKSMLLGTYEQDNVAWAPKQTPWDFVFQLLPPDLDRIAPELERGFAHFPAVGRAGIQKVVNGPFTFSPDGNPLVGPVRGLRNYWVACAVMAGLSQGGGVGLSLANWMVNGVPGDDIFGMDVARYGEYATLAYTNAKVRENYSRRFRITFPNEELAAARPLRTTPIHGRLNAANAVWGASFGLEQPLWFQTPGEPATENITFYRSNAFERVGDECRAVRERVGITETSNFAKYEVSGPGAEAWLSRMLTNRVPAVGRIVLSAMLNETGRIEGEFSVARTAPDHFLLFGSLPAEVYHSRWFLAHVPADGRVTFRVIGLGLVGLSVAGPRSRDLLQTLTDTDLSTANFKFMDFKQVNIGPVPAWMGRMTYSGDLGYELWVAPEYQLALYDALKQAGEPFGLADFGLRALLSLRLEKNYGTWFREYRCIYTPLEAGMDRYLRFDHDFIGRAAVEAEQAAGGPKRKLVAFTVETGTGDEAADVIGDEPVWHDGTVVGWITSGGYAHHVQRSVALGYVPTELAAAGTEGFEIEIIGRRRPARLQPEPLFDPAGQRMRA